MDDERSRRWRAPVASDNGHHRGGIDWDTVPYCSEEPIDRDKYLLHDGDIVISRAGSVGYSCLIKNPQLSVFASYLIRFRPLIDERYVSYFLQSPDYWQAISESSLGIAIPNVNATKLRRIPFPLAPLPEQRRIVAEIEKQFTRLDAGVAALKRVQANLKRYRASVFKAACEGRLAPQDPADEPADRLLARILVERRAKWEAEHPGKKYVEPTAPITDGMPELPVGWCWVRIGDIFDVTIGGTPSRSKAEYWSGDVPWVSSGEVAFNRIKATREHITREGLANSNAKLHPPGTVLLAMIGKGKTRGQAAILETAATTNQNIASLLVSETQILSGWIFYWLESRYEETRKSGSGGMQYALNSGRIKDFVCPVPPLSEQHRIVAEVERRLSVVAEVGATVAVNLVRAVRLRQAVLKRAFEGRLVAQDASDESADMLLARIHTPCPSYA